MSKTDQCKEMETGGCREFAGGKETDIPEAKEVRRTRKVIKIHPEKGPWDSCGGLCKGNYQRLRTRQDNGGGRG